MDPERTRDLKHDYQTAFRRLEDALHEDLSKGSIVIDGTIQRFEFTFELAWKLLKSILRFQGVETSTPRAAIKEGFKSGLIRDGEGWIDMLEDRNRTSHIYDELQARQIYDKIKSAHVQLFRALAALP